MQPKGYKLSFLSSGHVMYNMMIAVQEKTAKKVSVNVITKATTKGNCITN